MSLTHPCPWNRDKGVGVGIDFGHVRRYPGGYHYGIDLNAPVGEAILAAADGLVILVEGVDVDGLPLPREQLGDYGCHVHIYHEQLDLFTVYGHLSYVGVSVGDDVAAGERFASCGNTGNSTGPHLHFEVREGSDDKLSVVDPMLYIEPRPDYYSGAWLRWR